MRLALVLKNGFRFRGEFIEENEEELTINDVKEGRTTLKKNSIVARSTVLEPDEGASNE